MMLWLVVALANWLTAGVCILVGELQNKILDYWWHQHRTLHTKKLWLTDSTLWQIFRAFQSLFGLHRYQCHCIQQPLMPNRMPLGNFALSETPKCLSKSSKVKNGLTEVLETPKHSVGVSDLSGTFLTQVSKHFQPKLSEVLDQQDLKVVHWCILPTMMPWFAVALTN